MLNDTASHDDNVRVLRAAQETLDRLTLALQHQTDLRLQAEQALAREIEERTARSATQERGLSVLREVLQRLRWDDQGGYPGLTNGRWAFVSTSLPQTVPEELDALFALVGVVPDEIVPLGVCADCAHSRGGRERGYERPCGACLHPKMSNFVPAARLSKG